AHWQRSGVTGSSLPKTLVREGVQSLTTPCHRKLPLAADVRVQVVQSFQDTAISVIWATLAASAAQSAVILLSYLTLGVPAAFLAAGATFLLAWIPLVGSSPVWLTGAMYRIAYHSAPAVRIDWAMQACIMQPLPQMGARFKRGRASSRMTSRMR